MSRIPRDRSRLPALGGPVARAALARRQPRGPIEGTRLRRSLKGSPSSLWDIVYPMADAPPPVALGPVDFSTHVLSLASSALIALGKMPAPDGQPHPLDLEAARHLIDVLGMLEAKTKGNLDEAEQKLLASLIYDLRVAFVDAQNAAKKA